MKNIFNKIKNILILVTAFLFGVNLNNKTSLFCVILLVLTVPWLGRKNSYKIRASRYSLVIIATLLSYTLISFLHKVDMQQVAITYFILPLAAYLAGYFIVKMENGSLIYKKVIIYISAGLFVYGILNILQRYEKGYNTIWWVASGRMCSNFWTGIDMWPTLEATFFLPLSSLFFYALIINKNILLKLTYLAAFMASMWAAFDIGSRAIIVLSLVMVIVLLFYYYKNAGIMQSKKLALLVKLLVAALIAVILYKGNISGIKDTIESSNLYSRMTGQTYDNVDSFFALNGRGVRYNIIFKEMPTHLLGGIDLGGDVINGGLGSAHNTWLDIYRDAGIIPFILFIICTIILIRRMRYIIKADTIFNGTTMPLLSVLIIINIQFLSESIFILNTQLLNFYFMLCGMTDCIYLTLRMKSDNHIFASEKKEKPLLGLFQRRGKKYEQSKAS